MANEPLKHINIPMTDEQRQEAMRIREGVMAEFPPKAIEQEECPPGIPRRIHDARKQRGLTRYELGKSPTSLRLRSEPLNGARTCPCRNSTPSLLR